MVTQAKSKKDEAKARSFVAEWTALEARGRAVDYERAALVDRWTKRMGADEVSALLRDDVGLGPPRLLKIARQVSAFALVPNRKTWEALGWGWVGRLAGLEDAADRARVEKALLALAEIKGGVLQDGTIKDELRRLGAVALLPKPRDPNEADAGDALFRRELERLVRSGIVAVSAVDPYVAKVGRFVELFEAANN